MKLINPSFEIIEQAPGIEGVYKQIELAARNCYKSESLITDDSYKKFLKMLYNKEHLACFEHGTVYLSDSYDISAIGSFRNSIGEKYRNNKYSTVTFDSGCDFRGIYVTTNLRVLLENNWLDDLKYICEPTEYHEKRITIRFTADIHFYKDITRHRLFSWAIESTRYCNYFGDKFNMSVSFMKPTWIKEEDIQELEEDCKVIESIYFKWINKGYQAQHAAYFLTQGVKADIIMTGFVSDYKHFFELRDSNKAHPDVQALARPLHEEFIKRGYISDNIIKEYRNEINCHCTPENIINDFDALDVDSIKTTVDNESYIHKEK